MINEFDMKPDKLGKQVDSRLEGVSATADDTKPPVDQAIERYEEIKKALKGLDPEWTLDPQSQ